jgi:lysine 2,3-aminomutase
MTDSKSLRSIEELAAAGLVDAPDRAGLAEVASRYAVAITPAMVELIDRSDPNDPIARQFVPDRAELKTRTDESNDPIGDAPHSPVPGIVHRYPDRVLLKIVHVCAVYCRFCFRRAMVGPGKAQTLTKTQLDTALDYVRAHPEIWEVILTGGDPLVLSPARLRRLMADLGAIDHVKVVRFHTRIPVVEPKRISGALVGALRASGKATYVVIHANHARELTAAAQAACARLIDAGVPMLSQSVLLRGINDDVETLEALMRALVETRIKPYYLHHADLAPGTAHMRTRLDEGQALMRELAARVSGLCQPAYVLDIPGGHGKVPAGPRYVEPDAEPGCYVLSDPRGDSHRYVDTARPRRQHKR